VEVLTLDYAKSSGSVSCAAGSGSHLAQQQGTVLVEQLQANSFL